MGSSLLCILSRVLSPYSTMGRCLNICKIVSACTGLVFIVLGASLKWGIFPAVVNSMIISTLQLNPENKETWEAWKKPPIIPYMKFTFFSVTNTAEVKAGTAKPNVTEIGPFSYREVREKTNIFSIQDEISFGSYIHYEFDEAESCDACKIDTEVTVINPVMVIISTLLEDAHEMTWPDINIPGTPLTIQDAVELILDTIGTTLNLLTLCDNQALVDLGLCDDMWLTATPDNMIFQGTHSGIIKSLNFWLHDIEFEIGLPFLLKPLLTQACAEAQSIAFCEEPITMDKVVEVIDYLLSLVEIPPLIDLN